jgi:hypothetical protein
MRRNDILLTTHPLGGSMTRAEILVQDDRMLYGSQGFVSNLKSKFSSGPRRGRVF